MWSKARSDLEEECISCSLHVLLPFIQQLTSENSKFDFLQENEIPVSEGVDVHVPAFNFVLIPVAGGNVLTSGSLQKSALLA